LILRFIFLKCSFIISLPFTAWHAMVPLYCSGQVQALPIDFRESY
jgi:hypothetical protein